MPDAVHARVQRELFIRSFFDTTPPAELAELLAAQMRDRVFERGEVIYERGHPSGQMFFITEGTVELSAPGEEPWVIEDRAFIGGIDANSGEPHHRTARARTRIRAIEMHFESYLTLLEDFFDFAKNTLIQGARRTHETSLELAPDGLYLEPTEPSGKWLTKGHLDDVQRLIALRAARAFACAPVQPLVTLARQAIEERHASGETLFQAGEASRGMFVVIDGRVTIRHTAPEIRCMVGPGDLALGVLAIVPEPYPFSAFAETPSVVLRIGHEDLFDAMEEHFGLGRSWWAYTGRENERIRQALAHRELAQQREGSSTGRLRSYENVARQVWPPL